ncbi:hypothetical protein BEN48_10990 [Hymenobacter glacialis]|uniref:Secretion system C-terminal sorting domain-containing protein n=1 Tax=Hymenobacter glacialis TaxID=1908236 RepID=A0A1G1TAE8_9BACT|nr:hypothetical protein BEN48_10990 [Hymenobacter glacialis]
MNCNNGPVAGTNANEQACDAEAPSFCKPLPVELVSFTAIASNQQKVSLKWATATEKNSANFVVERSADGKDFQAVRTVPAAGHSTGRIDYEVVDDKPLTGTSYCYYRLKQVDLDATFSYSPVRAVKLSSVGNGALDVYPGNVDQQWVASSNLPAEVMSTDALQVVDILGRVQSVPFPAIKEGRWTLDMHMLPAGVYIVRLKTSMGLFSQRIVK